MSARGRRRHGVIRVRRVLACVVAVTASSVAVTACGDGAVHEAPTTDGGPAEATSSGDGGSRDTRRDPKCGDGTLDPAEACDDGNVVSGDGCNATCALVEPGYTCPVPGDRCAEVTPSNWMQGVGDGATLSALSVPGAHDSCALYEPLPGTAKTQDLTLGDQLAAGVRYLDIRCRHVDDAFVIHHGPVYEQMSFDDVLAAAFGFLGAHPSETILMAVKEEFTPSATTRTFEQTFATYVQKNAAGWYLDATVPALGAARGKIVLLRRFPSTSPSDVGIDATAWADDATFTIEGRARLRIQDEYEVFDDAAKWTAIRAMFDETRSGDAQTLFLNYTSGYTPLVSNVPNIPSVSSYVNPKLVEYLGATAPARTGVVAMDFVDPLRAGLVLATNFPDR